MRRGQTGILIAVLALALLTGSAACAASGPPPGDAGAAYSATTPAAAHLGGLTCFSIMPPKTGASSCDQLCAAKQAVCVSLKTNGAMNPGAGCGDPTDPKYDGGNVVSCRCCAVAR